MSAISKLRDSVVVITGASGGIGRASAHAFSRVGATVVLAARREEALNEVLRECEQLGGRGIVVPCDVSDADQVEHLADVATKTYERLDVWVNNAAVSLFGRIEETPREDYERVLNTNILGYVNGSRVAIRQFREQGAGRLINVSSMVAHTGQPYVSAYVTTKWAIRGLTESLRMELADAPDISATTILPAVIDTPIYQQAGNYTGRRVKSMNPVYSAEEVAEAIVKVAASPRREVIVGHAGRQIALVRTLCPLLGERMVRRQVESDHFEQGPPFAATSGNIYKPAAGLGSVSGGWMARGKPGNSSVMPLVLGAIVVIATAAGVAAKHRWRLI